jgi:hypothetical protein
MKEKITKLNSILALIVFVAIVFPIFAQAFVRTYEISSSNPPGFFQGIWHGLLAPYALIAQLSIKDVVVYASLNLGWNYNVGFIVGVLGSLHIGWACAIISYLGHIHLF